MTLSIALAGKGGTGKTTIAGMLIKYLIEKNKTPILAVDADSNTNLNDVLGLKIKNTLGKIREEMKKGEVPIGMTKDTFISMKLQESIIEEKEFDLIAMGRPEGSGCYCAANTLLSAFLEKLSTNYPYIVIDNEAGMEHISRLTTKNIDILLLIADSSKRSVDATIRINDLTKKLNIGVKKTFLIINKIRKSIDDSILDLIKRKNLEFIGEIPDDKIFYEYDSKGIPSIEINEKNLAIQSAHKIFDKIIK